MLTFRGKRGFEPADRPVSARLGHKKPSPRRQIRADAVRSSSNRMGVGPCQTLLLISTVQLSVTPLGSCPVASLPSALTCRRTSRHGGQHIRRSVDRSAAGLVLYPIVVQDVAEVAVCRTDWDQRAGRVPRCRCPNSGREDGWPVSWPDDHDDSAGMWLEATLFDEIPAGDHTIVLLSVRGLQVASAATPVIFHGSAFRRLGS